MFDSYFGRGKLVTQKNHRPCVGQWKICIRLYQLWKDNLNKTNNHLSTQIIEHKKNTTTYDIGNLGPGLRQAQQCGRIKLANGTQPYPLGNWVSNSNTDVKKDKNLLSTITLHHYTGRHRSHWQITWRSKETQETEYNSIIMMFILKKLNNNDLY